MKQFLRALTLSAGVAFAGGVFAQPTLTASGINPVIGETFYFRGGTYVSPGSGGSNQTWDFTSLSSGTPDTAECITPAQAPHGSSFPNSNIAMISNGGETFLQVSSNAMVNWGLYGTNSGNTFVYSDGEDLLRYPMTMGNSYTDPFSLTYVQAGYTYYRDGSVTVTADGYGTVITPNGTYTNCLRVHFVEDYRDSAFVGIPFTTQFHNDQYFWYKEGSHLYLALSSQLSMNGNLFASTSTYIEQGLVGTTEPISSHDLSLSPNPAHDQSTLSFSLPQGRLVNVEIWNTLGQQVSSLSNVPANAGQNLIELDLNELQSGMYIVKVSSNGTTAAMKRLQVSH